MYKLAADQFQSTLPVRGATARFGRTGERSRFQSTLPVRGATLCVHPPEKEVMGFQSTLPVRGATGAECHGSGHRRTISIHAPREGSDGTLSPFSYIAIAISIHAPREGSDLNMEVKKMTDYISIHAPREGSDSRASAPIRGGVAFQSTLPVRGATFADILGDINEIFQSTLPVRGATCRNRRAKLLHFHISIHAPREGSDSPLDLLIVWLNQFQSTLPVRGATCGSLQIATNPKPFQSTLPVRGATGFANRPLCQTCAISIHAPREGSDETHGLINFLQTGFSIHAPREGSDLLLRSGERRGLIFNPRSP